MAKTHFLESKKWHFFRNIIPMYLLALSTNAD
jgi:hypothetical protein